MYNNIKIGGAPFISEAVRVGWYIIYNELIFIFKILLSINIY